MASVLKIVKMDMAVCRKPMIIMIFSMVLAGAGCLFWFTPLLLGLFVVGSTAVVSAVFSVETKSNMELFYGCFPIKKWEYVVGRSLTSLLVIAVPSVISILFVQIGMQFSLCRIEEVRLVMEACDKYQMVIICAMIMLSLVGGTNLLLAAFAGAMESREIMEVVLLLLEGVVAGLVMFIIQKMVYHGNTQKFLDDFMSLFSRNELISCMLILLAGVIIFIAGTLAAIKVYRKRMA